jgi:hypothetical protein
MATARSGASEDIGALLYGKEVPYRDCSGVNRALVYHTEETNT